MKINCSQTDFKTNLSLVSRAVPSRLPSHPILANVLLIADADKNKVDLIGFDLSLGIRTSFPAQVEESGSITLPAKLLNDIVTRLPEVEITLSYEEEELEDNPLVNIISLVGKFQLRGMKSDDFPELPVVDNEQPLTLNVSSLSDGLQSSVFAASNDESKQVLTGIHLTRNSDTLEFAATDGHRIVVVQTDDDNEETQTAEETENDNVDNQEAEVIDNNLDAENFEVTIPARALRELEQILKTAKKNESISLYVGEGQVVFQLGEQNLTSRKLDGGYPNYNQLIPREFSRIVILERKRLISTLERVSVLANQNPNNNLVRFSLNNTEEQVTLSVEAQELGSAKESLPAQITGEDLEIGFNIKYLMEGLKVMSSNDIKMQFNEPNQPIIINPLGKLKMTYLLMPVRLGE